MNVHTHTLLYEHLRETESKKLISDGSWEWWSHHGRLAVEVNIISTEEYLFFNETPKYQI
jgi:hypothetical protein